MSMLIFKEISNLSEVTQSTSGDNRIQAEPKLVSLPRVHGLLRWSTSVLSKVKGAVGSARTVSASAETHIQCYINIAFKNSRIQMPPNS